MSDQFNNRLDPATANVLAAAAFARRKAEYARKKAGGIATQADDLQFAVEQAAEQRRILAYHDNNNTALDWEANMDYMPHAYAFSSQPQPQMFYQAMPYPAYLPHPHPQLDEYYGPYGTADYVDFMDGGTLHDEFGDGHEISTRPRLTKEQSEVLEAHFQANHKPSSQVKKQLAIQTNLKLQRVGNWFQNRRAKAKQQKRQEEYEARNAGSKTDSKDPPASNSKPAVTSPTRSVASPTKESSSTSNSTAQSSPSSPVRRAETLKEAGWASLQRALGQAKTAPPPAHPTTTMSPPELLPQTTMQLPLRLNGHQPTSSTSNIPTWPSQPANAASYPSPITLQDNSFDFGFDKPPSTQTTTTVDSAVDYAQDAFVVTPEEDWQEPLTTPKGIVQQSTTPVTTLPSPGLSLSSYPGSRRQSTTEDLSNNFGNFALVGNSPRVPTSRRPSEPIRPPESGPLDIAARRKRPRPPALTSASLRSRSYGALTSVSPTFRQGVMSPQGPHSVRHVKSAGQSLHSRYAGIRKASSAQRSPMCASSFAEAEAFNQLMAQQAITAQSLAELSAPLLSPDFVSNDPMTDPEKNPFFAQNIDMSNQYGMMDPGHSLSVTAASPPITPMVPDYMSRAHSQQSLVPPASAPPQYASFPDYTPPYSAGPLTNSSWSDAPLTSPEIPSFPPVTYVPSLGYPQCEGFNGQFQQFVLPSDTKSDINFDSDVDQKKTEFYIQEFPNQKEEHAHVAQQLAQQKPKNYVFANTAAQDYTGA